MYAGAMQLLTAGLASHHWRTEQNPFETRRPRGCAPRVNR